MYLTKYLFSAPCGNKNTLCMSALTGALDVVPNELFEKLTAYYGGIFDPELPKEIKSNLINRGYLFETESDEEALFQHFRLEYMELAKKQPMNFWICPTLACNLRCTYCFEGDSRADTAVITEDMIKSIFLAMGQININNTKATVNIYGGEPLLNSTRAATALIIKMAAGNYNLNIITNGIHLPQYISMLKDYSEAINRVQVTLDGIKTVHDATRVYYNGAGSFDKVVVGIDALIEAGIKTQIRSNLDENGCRHFSEFVEFARQKNWINNPLVNMYFTMVNDHHCGDVKGCLNEADIAAELINIRENIPAAEPIKDIDSTQLLDAAMVNLGYVSSRDIGPKFHFCNANYGKVYVFGPSGQLYFCPSAVGHEDLLVGTYYPKLDINQKALHLWIRPSVEQLPRCAGCKAILLCGGGCTFKALKIKGDAFCQNPETVFGRFVEICQDSILRRAESNG